MKPGVAAIAAFVLTALLVLQCGVRAVEANELLRIDPTEVLVNAAAQGDLASVQRQLAARTDPNVPSKSLSLAMPLVQAAANGHGSVISALLKAGALVDARDGRGQRAITVAAYHGRLDVCRQLLAVGARVEAAPADELAPLVAGVMSDNVAITDLFLQAGAPVMHSDPDVRNALVIAARIGNEKMVSTLLHGLAKQVNSSERSLPLLLLARDEATQAKHANVAGLIEQRITR
jgi:ankyrin repeat protein